MKNTVIALLSLLILISCNKNDDSNSGGGSGGPGSSSVSATIYFGMSPTPWSVDNSENMFMRFNPSCGHGYLAARSGNYLIEIEIKSSSSLTPGTTYTMGPNEDIRLDFRDISSGETYTTNQWPGNGTFTIDSINYSDRYVECTFSCSAYNNSNVGVSIDDGKVKQKDYGPSASNSFSAEANVNPQDYFTCDPSGVLYPSDSKIRIKAYASNDDWISFEIPSSAAAGNNYSLTNQAVTFDYYFQTPPAPPVVWTDSIGLVNIISHDPAQKTIVGTFEYRGTHPFVSDLNITQGAFNIRYDRFPL